MQTSLRFYVLRDILLETKRKPGRVNFRKDFWDLYQRGCAGQLLVIVIFTVLGRVVQSWVKITQG